MTKREAYNYCEREGYGFMANVIYTRGVEVAKRIKGLAKLIQDEVNVRVAQFDIDTIIVEGEAKSWGYLATVK
jgi:hypothetical protein